MRRLHLTLLFLGVASCSFIIDTSPHCQADDGCPPTQRCVDDLCVARACAIAQPLSAA